MFYLLSVINVCLSSMNNLSRLHMRENENVKKYLAMRRMEKWRKAKLSFYVLFLFFHFSFILQCRPHHSKATNILSFSHILVTLVILASSSLRKKHDIALSRFFTLLSLFSFSRLKILKKLNFYTKLETSLFSLVRDDEKKVHSAVVVLLTVVVFTSFHFCIAAVPNKIKMIAGTM